MAPEGRKVGSLTLGAEPCGQMRDEKLHAIVARSIIPSQNEHTIGPCSDHFWQLWFLKSACRFGTKHIWNSKCTKHFSVGASLEVEMSKKCMPLWREAHFEVKRVKNLTSSEHLWTFRYCFAWQASGIMHLVKSEQIVRDL